MSKTVAEQYTGVSKRGAISCRFVPLVPLCAASKGLSGTGKKCKNPLFFAIRIKGILCHCAAYLKKFYITRLGDGKVRFVRSGTAAQWS